MNIQLPDPKSFGGAVLNGWTAAPVDVESFSGVIVVKAAYDLIDTGGAQRTMVRSSDAARSAIVFQDSGTPVSDGYVLTREADIALQKACVDIVVKGWGGTDVEGHVQIDGTEWLTRAPGAAGPGDFNTNLFGWHSRTEDNRSFNGVFPSDDFSHLPPGFAAKFNNFYRRSDGFTPLPESLAHELPSGKIVRIVRKDVTGDASYAVALPDLSMKARLRAWCGDCPDEPKRWCIVDTIALSPDTLIIDPVGHTAEILWRGRFDWHAVPEGKWRLAQVMEGSV
ncbi:hypothetical protein QO002_004357 [Pararhizobium capsulatum DSM 1112]|uniref:Uncharacterized protein n=1 Tax=Pararhizobium capsulatum DSM 1112 TaxID=1121113 RepID=A0ABU0BV73_9HYPH|nr:hypothetical protein [Pararhizobium capsulatum]MDQ0322151.1 hypothetical protein [Pararhizobium capsulatum DSM 1112]